MFWKDIKKIRKSIIKIPLNSYDKLKEEFWNKMMLVSEFSYLYQSMDSNKQNRRFVIQKYIVFYRIENQKVIILRILPQKVNYNQKGIYRIKSTNQLEFNK